MKIVFPDRIDLDETARAQLTTMGATFYDDTPDDPAIIAERIHDADIAAANFIHFTAQVIDTAPQLKYIIVPAVGYEWVDVKYAASKGIKVLNCPTQNSEAVAEHAIALMLAVSHRIVEAQTMLRTGEWAGPRLQGFEASGKQLGLVGYGRIGHLIEQKVAGFGMKVSHYNSKSTPADLDQLLHTSDIICLCLALNDQTRGLIDERRLNLLKPTAILINVARGALVDQRALYDLLKQGKLRGAGLDVFRKESFSDRADESIVDLARLPNVVATPHLAYNTDETRTRLGLELIANLQSCLDSRPINVVTSA